MPSRQFSLTARVVLPAVLLLLFPGSGTSRRPAAEPMPRWLHDHMAALTAGTATWVTDNSKFKSADEPFDAYATSWSWGLGRQSLKGRLYGIKDGKEAGTFWEFRLYWQPSEKKAVMLQFGNGAVGEGTMWEVGPDSTESDQTFSWPDGSQTRLRHLSRLTGGEHLTASFDWSGTEWQPRRTYLWHLQKD